MDRGRVDEATKCIPRRNSRRPHGALDAANPATAFRAGVKLITGPAQPQRFLLGIDGGGTRTVALFASEDGHILRRIESGPANLKLLTDTQLLAHLRSI